MLRPEDLWVNLYALINEGIDKDSKLAYKDSNGSFHYLSKHISFVKNKGIIFFKLNEEYENKYLEEQSATIGLACDNLKINCFSCCEDYKMSTDGKSLLCPENHCKCFISDFKITEDFKISKDIPNIANLRINSVYYDKLLNLVILEV